MPDKVQELLEEIRSAITTTNTVLRTNRDKNVAYEGVRALIFKLMNLLIEVLHNRVDLFNTKNLSKEKTELQRAACIRAIRELELAGILDEAIVLQNLKAQVKLYDDQLNQLTRIVPNEEQLGRIQLLSMEGYTPDTRLFTNPKNFTSTTGAYSTTGAFLVMSKQKSDYQWSMFIFYLGGTMSDAVIYNYKA